MATISSSAAIPAPLPGDVATCHALIESLAADLNQYKQRIDYLLRRLFGSTSERIDPDQLHLFKEALEQTQEAPAAEEETETPPRAKRKGHGRQRLPEDLPRTRVEHDIPDEEKTCPNGHDRVRIGEDVSEQLDFTPASYFVIEHVRPVYACIAPDCDCGVIQASKPAQPIEKGLAGPGLLAHIITSKYCDHLPLYRQEQIIARHGIHLSRKTLCDWVMQTADLLAPVVDAMRGQVLQSKAIHTDDTPVRVQDQNKKRTTSKAYLWPYLGDAEHPYTVFDYTPHAKPGRSRDISGKFLRNGNRTTLPAMRRLPRLQRTLLHKRTGIFSKSLAGPMRAENSSSPRSPNPSAPTRPCSKSASSTKSSSEAKELDTAERCALRQEKAAPILEAFNERLIALNRDMLPKSPIGMAAAYALRNWDALTRYTTDGDLNIDNNPAENAVRAVALGRKNWLFLGSDRGGHAAAIHFSLIASARRHGLDPFAYLRDLLHRIPTHLNKKIQDLLPDRWKTLEN